MRCSNTNTLVGLAWALCQRLDVWRRGRLWRERIPSERGTHLHVGFPRGDFSLCRERLFSHGATSAKSAVVLKGHALVKHALLGLEIAPQVAKDFGDFDVCDERVAAVDDRPLAHGEGDERIDLLLAPQGRNILGD